MDVFIGMEEYIKEDMYHLYAFIFRLYTFFVFPLTELHPPLQWRYLTPHMCWEDKKPNDLDNMSGLRQRKKHQKIQF